MNFGDTLLKIRKSKNISQEQLAKEIGVSRQTVSNWELNITIPNIDDLKKISEALHVSYDKLLNSNSGKLEEKNGHIKTSKLFIMVLRVIGILFLINLFVLGIIYTIWRINYERKNEVGSYRLVCYYTDESGWTYNIGYNKKRKIVDPWLEGHILEEDKDKQGKWVEDLNKFIFSKEITDAIELKEYIMDRYYEHGGRCE